jgi:hypothetical protein
LLPAILRQEIAVKLWKLVQISWRNEYKKGYFICKIVYFLINQGFDINMHCLRAWSQRDTQAIIESPSARAVSHTIIGAISTFGALNISIRYSGNIKRRKIIGATKRKIPGDTASATPKRTTAGHYL